VSRPDRGHPPRYTLGREQILERHLSGIGRRFRGPGYGPLKRGQVFRDEINLTSLHGWHQDLPRAKARKTLNRISVGLEHLRVELFQDVAFGGL
jgi:hypothetical protein